MCSANRSHSTWSRSGSEENPAAANCNSVLFIFFVFYGIHIISPLYTVPVWTQSHFVYVSYLGNYGSCQRSLTPDTVQDVGPAPRVVSQELGVLDGGLAELAPQVRRGLQEAPEVV